MYVTRVAEGLWRWTAPHPDWVVSDDWGRDVGCVYHETPDAVVLIDPLVPDQQADSDRFWQALDRDVERVGQEVVVLTTIHWHSRSGDLVAERYGGRAVGLADIASAQLPTGVRAFPAPSAAEVVWWLEAPGALVPGDALLGDGSGGLCVCPAGWVDGEDTRAVLLRELAPLLDLPVASVLVSHGEPVLVDARAALARALGQPGLTG